MSFDAQLLQTCWFLAGPTAVGKTAASLELSARLGAEILALDSMTLYRGLNIGTDKPDRATRDQVPHHLLDVLEPHEEFSLAAYLRLAEGACRDILSRGRMPLFVGGAGMYLRGMLRGLFEGPSADWSIRKRWEELAAQEGNATLHEHLARVDPELAARLHPNDVRRVIRGLEVFELTGIPLSRQQQQPPLPIGSRPERVFWLSPPRGWLHARIDQRVLAMFERGLVDEVRGLLALERPLSLTARQALGYQEVLAHLEHHVPLEETIAQIQTRTRQFAKRQCTWFRNLEECREAPLTGAESPREIAEQILRLAETTVAQHAPSPPLSLSQRADA